MSETTDIIDDFPVEIPWESLDPEPVILDRSTLDRWADCPHQAALMEHHKIGVSNEDTEAGQQCHDAIAQQIEAVTLAEDHIVRPGEFADNLIQAGKACPRVDVQPRVARVLQTSAWTVARIVCERSASDILRFDGGKGFYSGQLAFDVYPRTEDRGARRVTGEVDLLLATPSREELDLYDWKSGYKRWTATDVSQSFQFQTYALLVFENYPEVLRVNVRVVMLADNDVTPVYTFERKYIDQYRQRVRAAVDLYDLHHGSDPADVPAWPTPSSCSICDAVRHCRVASDQSVDVASDPVESIQRLIALEAATERIRKYLTAKVREGGKDIIATIGGEQVAYGTNKPKASRAATCDLYEPP